ncbi:unnamed protein product [Vitrella brassicaformis CCMP3155]|uniref:Exostosin GT47 domain-containing protein n=1 Tax=Vitrella brassicaformis (strain CCMP3155) TaxID=1169540 RepID=A0A0G4GVN5_VITBC|nr:unnamed protein product [Vitrella brassicaformis CCMP3155]|eukprot:CEM34881.1 unnamed protein product [Vitrella brassicaformis CCMP3155]
MNIIQDASNDFADLKALERDIEVPFYIYQTPSIRKLYDLCQESARSILEGRWSPHFPLENRKNTNEIYWLDQLWNDTWRTFDPDKALVYVLPIYPVLLYHRSCKEGNRKKIHALADKAVKEVTETPQWERNRGLDHILVLTDFEFKYPGRMDMVFGRAFSTIARNITQGRHLADNQRGLFGCAVTIPHTSSLTALQKAYQPFEKESLLKRGLIQPTDVFEDDRLALAFDPPSRHDWFQRDYTMFFQGRSGLADVTSSRVADAFWARTLNVLINELDDVFRYGIPFQCEIPWRNFTYAIEGSVFEQDPRAALKPILDELYKDHRAVTKKLRLMDYYSKKILWNAPKSETARSVLRAMTRQCLTNEAKLDFIERTSKYGTAANVRDHPLFSECTFPDTSVKSDEQRKAHSKKIL